VAIAAAAGVATLDQALQLASLEALGVAEALAELDHASQSPLLEAGAELAVLVMVFETMRTLESVVVMTAGVLSDDQADQVLSPSLAAWTVRVTHCVLVEVTVSDQTLHVWLFSLEAAAGVLDVAHSLQVVAGPVLVLAAGVLLLSHSLHVLELAVVALVFAAGVLRVEEAHSLHVAGSVLFFAAGVLLELVHWLQVAESSPAVLGLAAGVLLEDSQLLQV